MTNRFDACLPLLLKHEGGFVDHPQDPGGATNLGVTIGTLGDHLGRRATKAEVRALQPADVAPIYRKSYWDAARCDDLPDGVDYMIFDLAVNSGPAKARRYLQEVVGVTADGVIGPKTLAAVAAVPPATLVRRLERRREAFYRSLRTFPTFGKGWLRRLSEVTTKSLEWAQ